MITKLQPLKNKLFLFFLLICSAGIFGQTTLVNYQFNNNLNPDATPAPIGNPILKYYNNSNNEVTPSYNNNRLHLISNKENHYIELTINTTGRENLIVSWKGEYSGALLGNAEWTLQTFNGTNWVNEYVMGLNWLNNSRTGSVELPAYYNNNANSKIRIKATTIGDGWLLDANLYLDDLKITSGSPKIKVYTGNNTDAYTDTSVTQNVHIPNLSPASRAFDTDFGTRQTTDAALTRSFRVRNYLGEPGSKLKVTNISVQGANPGDFIVSPTSLGDLDRTTVENSTSEGNTTFRAFNISFLPLGDGIRTAEIYIYSNAAPSPYIFTVIGTGASCTLTQSSFAENTMAAGQQTLTSNYTSTDLIGGYTTNNNAGAQYNTLGIRLFPNNSDLYTSSPTSWYVRGNTTKTVEFGGTTGLDISKQKNVAVNFRIAAFSTADNRGVTSADYVTLSVLKPDNTWSEELKLTGSNGTGTYYQNSFSPENPLNLIGNYDGNNTPLQVNNYNDTFLFWTTEYRYNQFTLNIPASANISNLKFRITAKSSDNNRLWLIDDVKVLSDNAVFKTYTTSNTWSPSAPNTNGNEKAIIQGSYTVPAANLNICECEVTDTGSVNIQNGRYMNVRGKITNLGDGSNFVVQSGANLIQIEDGAVNTGPITVRRAVVYSNNNRKEYNFFSSPVADQNMKELFGPASNTPWVQYLDEPNNVFKVAPAAMYQDKGRGFAVKEPKNTYTIPYAEFKGEPNNGIPTITVTHANEGWNLVGNPYPSNIDATKVYAASTNIESTFKFWDNTVNATYTYNGTYGQYSYAILNASTGIGNKAPGLDNGTPVGTKIPNRYISVGQGFIVEAKAGGGTVVFRNKLPNGDMMRTSSAPGATFFGKQASSDSLNLFRLQYKTPDGIVLTQTIAYLENGNNGYGVEDSPHPGLESLDLFYGFADDEKVLINGRAPFNTEDVLPLGYKAYKQGVYFISLSDHEGIFDNSQHIYLKDKYSGIITDLSESYYSFNTEEGEFTNRFEIVYKPEATLDVTGINKDAIQIYRDGDDFVVRSSAKFIKEVELYDMSGKLFYKTNANAKEVRIPAYRMVVNGIYILKAQLENGEIVNKKIRK